MQKQSLNLRKSTTNNTVHADAYIDIPIYTVVRVRARFIIQKLKTLWIALN